MNSYMMTSSSSSSLSRYEKRDLLNSNKVSCSLSLHLHFEPRQKITKQDLSHTHNEWEWNLFPAVYSHTIERPQERERERKISDRTPLKEKNPIKIFFCFPSFQLWTIDNDRSDMKWFLFIRVLPLRIDISLHTFEQFTGWFHFGYIVILLRINSCINTQGKCNQRSEQWHSFSLQIKHSFHMH